MCEGSTDFRTPFFSLLVKHDFWNHHYDQLSLEQNAMRRTCWFFTPQKEKWMKQGRELPDLAAELKRQLETKRDYVLDTRTITMHNDGEHIVGLPEQEKYGITEHFHDQVSDKLAIPRKYYDRMRVSWPALLATNVNTILHEEPRKRMVRTLDGQVRALLSDRYRPIDHADIAEVALPLIQEGGCEIVSCQLTSTHMYLKWVSHQVTGAVREGEIVEAGGMIANSEVGDGSFRVMPIVRILACLNGLIVDRAGLRKFHVGKQTEIEDGAIDLYSKETIQADNKALFLKVRDLVKAVLNQEGFEHILGTFRESTQREITASLPAVIKEVTGLHNLTGRQGDGILEHLSRGGDMTQWGLSQAVTRASQDEADYEMATELERVGGRIVALETSAWEDLMMATAA